MSPKPAISLIKSLIASPHRLSMFLSGPPGVGKSAVVAQAAREVGYNLLDIRVTLHESVDFTGVPGVEDGKTVWYTPDLFPSEGNWVVLLDELPDAPKMVQSALYRLIDSGCIGNYKAPDTVRFIAAGNRQKDRAAAGALSTALRSRFVNVEIEPSLDDWTDWALGADIRPEVIAFLRFRPECLYQFDPSRNTEETFPAPRTWEMVSRALDSNVPSEVELPLFSGCVGQGAGGEFASFLKICRKLPNPDAVLMDPDKAQVPDDSSVLYALSSALARKASQGNADRFFKYAARMPAEFSILMVRDAIRRDSEIQNTKAFIEFVRDRKDFLA